MKKPDLERGWAFLLPGPRTMTYAHAGQACSLRARYRAKLAEADTHLRLRRLRGRQSRDRPGLDPGSSCDAQRASGRM